MHTTVPRSWFLILMISLTCVITPAQASPKHIPDLIAALTKGSSVVDTSARLSDDLLKKIQTRRDLSPEELEQVRRFGALLEHSRLRDADIVLLDARGQPLRSGRSSPSSPVEQYVVEEIRQHLAPLVDRFVRRQLVAGKTEISLETIASDFAKRLDQAPKGRGVTYSFNVTTGALGVSLKRGNRELHGSVNVYDKLLTVGIAVAGYQTVAPSPATEAGAGGAGDASPVAVVLVLLLGGVVCGAWAQYSGRSGVLWFVLGLVLNVVAWALVLFLTHRDLKAGRTRRWAG